jgi:hypothetical protein
MGNLDVLERDNAEATHQGGNRGSNSLGALDLSIYRFFQQRAGPWGRSFVCYEIIEEPEQRLCWDSALSRAWDRARTLKSLFGAEHLGREGISPKGLLSGHMLCWPNIAIRQDFGQARGRIAPDATDTKQRIRESFVQGEFSPFLDRQMKTERSHPVVTFSCAHSSGRACSKQI